MKYDFNKDVIIATYADGGVVASLVRPDKETCYNYMCVFESEECARAFTEKHVDGSVFYQTKKFTNLIKEFNCGIVWPGLAGIAFIHNNNDVDHIDTSDLIKMAFKYISARKSYGCDLVVNNQIAPAKDVDFNKRYFVMSNQGGYLVINRTYDSKGRKRDWLVVATNKKLLQGKATELGMQKQNVKIVEDTLSGLLMCFLPRAEFDGVFAGIKYIDENGSQIITKKRIRKLLTDRQNHIDQLCVDAEIYLDAKYFISADKKYSTPTISRKDGIEYLVVSQRMDTMLKAFKLEGLNTKNTIFTNLMTLREIIMGCPASGCGGVAICLDDNPDHIAYLSVNDVFALAHNGTGDEDENCCATYSNEFMKMDRQTLMLDGGYIINTIQAPDTGETIDVILLADSEKVLVNSLEETGYVFGDEKVAARQIYEIFSEFRDGQLEDCDGIMWFDGDGGFYLMPKEMIVDNLEKWENAMEQKSHRVGLDFNKPHFVVRNESGPIAYTHPNGTAFLMVAKELRWAEKAVEELFGLDNDFEYTDDQTLEEISKDALSDGFGIVMCDYDGVTFVEPHRLEQAMLDE